MRNYAVIWFLLGVFSKVSFIFFGEWILIDVIALLAIVFTGPYFLRNVQWTKKNTITVFFLLLYPALIVFLNAIHGVPFIMSVKQAGKFALILPVFAVFFFLFKRSPDVFWSFLIGNIFGTVFHSLFGVRTEEAELLSSAYTRNAFILAPIVTALAVPFVLFIAKYSRFISIVLLLLVIVVTAVVLDIPRSTFLPYFTLIGILALSFFVDRGGARHQVNHKNIVVQSMVWVLVSLTALYLLYIMLAPTGILGELERGKYLAQSQSRFGNSPIGLIGVSRFQAFVAMFQFMDSPWIGFGSYSTDNLRFIPVAADFLGIPVAAAYDRYNLLVTSHSAIMEGLVSYGVLAMPFWGMLIWAVVRACFTSCLRFLQGAPLEGYILFIGTATLWGIFFSPFTSNAKVYCAILLAYSFIKFRKPIVRRLPRRMGNQNKSQP